ncbi:DUF1513 domain-containing protein [Psychrobium sp. 1_MG-2023]|uniref:DUF1513 domain-containing protein n=1 Tax=Psychrobium sp. 1_MG-2023 TaxID=3062624 RepID=UPI000C33258F|nr:DUF1513 domain-containing protein [Psychrobium sp. 1_MG-2023]MDP2562870.1 DUF1513 domain-containing protein [Psychrobium sp. 1_MG-2023]PKF57153.1 DUF1513 domain-containing protein [Alteromonadales bacterium alter-6D02]
MINQSRRHFIQQAVKLGCGLTTGAVGVGLLGGCKPLTAGADRVLFASALKLTGSQGKTSGYFLGFFDKLGQLISKVKLPSRGHDVVAVPNKPHHALVFARRPGYFAIEVNGLTGEITNQFKPQPSYHFYGHGCFDASGRYLFCTENKVEPLSSRGQGTQAPLGVITIRDANNYQLLSQMSAGGVGPHQCVIMPDNNTLAVANGGIFTHPDKPREKLNLTTMQPNLSYLDVESGKVLASYQPQHHQASLRHLAVSQTGQVIIGAQLQQPLAHIEPLIYSHHGESKLRPLVANDNLWQSMNGYTASVAIDSHHQVAAVTCPRGGLVSYWDLVSLNLLSSERFKDCAGVGVVKRKFFMSNGKGRLASQVITTQAPAGLKTLANHNTVRWDNHLAVISPVVPAVF